MQDRYAEIDNMSHQQKLAASLLANQSLEGAIRSCQEFGWDGVLDCLLNTRVPGQALEAA